jgi:demethylmenaquinone methyltransferase/2-methoxy-6-polyprenyl-1,4-benzoquinol methylase
MSDDTADLDARFGPRAARPMAEMFDHVSGRYDVINRLLSLGQDAAWRQAMWREVPESARTVLDLCTGNGVSLPGLRRAGRLVIGADVSLRMLDAAADEQRTTGWGPRLVCADAFQLPFPEASLDAITIAFGMRNLRPRDVALAEMRRVLRPGGVLVVLEATAPRGGAVAPFHRLYLERVVPAAGRLSDDPSAYRYLAASVLEFGAGPEFESALAAAGFSIEGRRAFLMGATRLWSARRATPAGQFAAVSPSTVQAARSRGAAPSHREREWRAWGTAQAVISASLLAGLGWAAWVLLNSGARLPLPGWSRGVAWFLLGLGCLAFGLRTVVLLRRLLSGPPRG